MKKAIASRRTNYGLKFFCVLIALLPIGLMGINILIDQDQSRQFNRLGLSCDPLFPFLGCTVWFLIWIAVTVFAGNKKSADPDLEQATQRMFAEAHKDTRRKKLSSKEFKKRYPKG